MSWVEKRQRVRNFLEQHQLDALYLSQVANFAWNPSITGMKSEDTTIVHTDGLEFIIVTREWPTLAVTVADRIWERPSILVT